jgi:hypothetical protein
MSELEKDPLLWLQNWFLRQVNGDWERCFGIGISTLNEKQGWRVGITLTETSLAGKHFEAIEKDLGDDDWIMCHVSEEVFEALCAPTKLVKALEIFRDWSQENEEPVVPREG